jgi:hypothetical protein
VVQGICELRAVALAVTAVVLIASPPSRALDGPPPAADAPTCVPRMQPAPARRADVPGVGRVVVRLDSRTRTATVRAPRGTITSVTWTLDGSRVRRLERSPYRLTVPDAGLATGRHALTALIVPRHGKARFVTIRFMRSC